MARYVDMDACPCNKCKTMMSGDCLPLYEGCQNYEEWYEGVDAVPVVHGHWLKATGMMPPEYFGRHICSVCDHFAPNDYHGKHEFLSPICPYCGAKMDEDGEQE